MATNLRITIFDTGQGQLRGMGRRSCRPKRAAVVGFVSGPCPLMIGDKAFLSA
jgi:hypothetical protein